jgi:DNA-binding NtrC family response regulator
LNGRCLVLDDDRQVLTAWHAMLESWGVDARFASTAAEAFGHLDRGFVPAAIFCDQRLRSGESGFDILRELLARCPGASGAMVSGELHSAELMQAEDEGYLVLRKPLDLLALHAVLDNWLNRSVLTAQVR